MNWFLYWALLRVTTVTFQPPRFLTFSPHFSTSLYLHLYLQFISPLLFTSSSSSSLSSSSSSSVSSSYSYLLLLCLLYFFFVFFISSFSSRVTNYLRFLAQNGIAVSVQTVKQPEKQRPDTDLVWKVSHLLLLIYRNCMHFLWIPFAVKETESNAQW